MAKKVTIVEDDLNLLNSVAEKLRAEGYTVSTATDGEQGWERVRADMPDLLVLDIMLKKLDGLSLCRMIRSDATTSHIPIIMMTARANEVDKIVGLESGADDYIVKPFGLGEFLARVRARLRQPSGGNAMTQSELVSNDIRVNMTGRREGLGI
jgi:DNA-binding response OmpR family regulator